MTRLWRSARDTEDEGLTLVELLVVMTIFTGLLALTFGVLIQAQWDTRDNMARADQVSQARLGLMQIDRHVRSGNVITDPLASGELPQSLRVYTQADGVRKCVQWQVHEGVLRYRSWDENYGAGGVAESWRTVARHLSPDALTPIFQAYPASVPGESPSSVQITLTLDAEEADGQPVEVSTVLTGRNTVYGYPADVCSPVPPA